MHCPLKIWTWMRSGGPLLDEPLVHPSLFCLFSLFNKHAASLKQQQQVGIIYYIHQIPNWRSCWKLEWGGSFEKICITVSFELGIIRITGACHLLCCVAFDLLYSAYLQTLCNILLVLLSLIHVNVIEILEEATATETDCCSCWQDGSNNVTARYQVPA